MTDKVNAGQGRPTLDDVRGWPATVSVTKAASALGCSRAQLYRQINLGTAPVRALMWGRSRVVITADLVRLLSGEGQHAA